MTGQEAEQQPPPEAPKRRRKRVSTTRTGCNTCKRRHLKCDEEKPRCRRCRDAGWPCGLDDYPQPQSKAVVLARQPGTLTGDSQERRSYDYYLDQAGYELSGWARSPFWHEVVLQRSHRDPAVRAALVAVSSLHESYRTGRDTEGRVILRTNVGNDRFILNHYTDAIKRIRERLGDLKVEDEETVLVCCLIFVAFENLRGNFDGAYGHLQAGLNILRSRQKSLIEGPSPMRPDGRRRSLYCRTDSDQEEAIVSFFSRLDIQATTFRGNGGLRLVVPESELDDKEVLNFQTLAESRRVCDYLMRQTLELLATPKDRRPDLTGPDSCVHFAHRLLFRIQLWRQSFESLVAKLPPQPRQILRGIYLVRMQHKTMDLLLKLGLVPDGYDSVPDFIEIVDNAENALRALDGVIPINKNGHRTPTFQSGMAVIGSLYWAAIRCPDFGVRRRAIAILKEKPRREGLWDSQAAARTAEKILEADEAVKNGRVRTPSEILHSYCEIKLPVQAWVTPDNAKLSKGAAEQQGVPAVHAAGVPEMLSEISNPPSLYDISESSPGSSAQMATSPTPPTDVTESTLDEFLAAAADSFEPLETPDQVAEKRWHDATYRFQFMHEEPGGHPS